MNAARGGRPAQPTVRNKSGSKDQEIGSDRSDAAFDAVAQAIQDRVARTGNVAPFTGIEPEGEPHPLEGIRGQRFIPTASFQPPAGPGASPTGQLVSWGGYRYDSGVIGKMQALSSQFGLKPSSGYRDPAHNARVGGVANSNHLTGRAGDFSGSSSAMNRGAAWARAQGAREVLIHNAGSGNHLHVAW